MNVFVTGATGFVGGHLIEVLLRRGDRITALVRDAARGRELARRGVRLVVGSLEDPADTLAGHLGDAEQVFHIAGLVAARSEAEFMAVNRDGTARLADAARRTGRPRFVLVSSLAAAGPAEPGHPLAGDEPPRPVTRYGRSKLAAEQALRDTDLPWTIVRPPAVYGPGDREMFRVFKAASVGVAPVFGRGEQQLSLVYGPDLADGIAAASGPAGAGQIFFAAHPEILTSRGLVEAAGQAAGKRVRVIGIPRWAGTALLTVTDTAARLANRATVLSADKAHEFFAPAWLADPSRLTAATGWTAAHDFSAGASATVAWYRQQGWL